MCVTTLTLMVHAEYNHFITLTYSDSGGRTAVAPTEIIFTVGAGQNSEKKEVKKLFFFHTRERKIFASPKTTAQSPKKR